MTASGGATSGKGSGLQGLADRVEAVGGRLHITSRRGRGTTIRAVMPTSVLASRRGPTANDGAL